MKSILVINGPNLNMLGIRQPTVYGNDTLDKINEYIVQSCKELPAKIEFYQSNHEGAIIDKLHEAYFNKADGIVINAGAYTHYSYAIRDAIASIEIPCVEVHLSDIGKREDFRKVSVIEEVCKVQIKGKGKEGYVEAIKWLIETV